MVRPGLRGDDAIVDCLLAFAAMAHTTTGYTGPAGAAVRLVSCDNNMRCRARLAGAEQGVQAVGVDEMRAAVKRGQVWW